MAASWGMGGALRKARLRVHAVGNSKNTMKTLTLDKTLEKKEVLYVVQKVTCFLEVQKHDRLCPAHPSACCAF